jgi:hypothetical protein
MLSAKLIKTLEKEGFYLDFPIYKSNDEIIIEILKENDSRLNLSLPIFLIYPFNYDKISSKLSKEQKYEFIKTILISIKICKIEKIKNKLKEIINKNRLKADFSKSEFERYYNSFKESKLNQDRSEQKAIEKQSKLRLNLDLNKSLNILFSPAKIKIMEKIFNHEPLTNTELKYYYRSVSNINKAVLTPALADYLRIIEITRKMVINSGKIQI